MRRARPLLGTFVEIAARGVARAELTVAVEGAFQAVAEVHRLMSAHDSHSDVGRLNREAGMGAVRVHPWTHEVLRTACELHEATAGTFDIVSSRHSSIDASPVRSDIELLAGHSVRFSRAGVRIDLGGIAKGFAVDRAIASLRASGIPQGLVNAGGDLALFGEAASLILIRDPCHPGRELCRIGLMNAALASSGRPFDPSESWEATESRIIDPKTRAPARGICGTTVRAPSCMIADALAKVVMLTGESATPFLEQYGASALFVSGNGELRATRDWSGTLALVDARPC